MAITLFADGRIIDSTGRDIAYKPVYDVWQLINNVIGDTAPIAGSNWARASTTNTNKSGAHTNVGAAMSVDSSGYWTFPSTGKWEVCFSCYWQSTSGSASRYAESFIYFTQNNSDYNYISRPAGSVHGHASYGVYDTFQNTVVLDVVNTSTHKCYFGIDSDLNSNFYLKGYTTFMATYASFKRITDT